jgi:hypothetical protein
MALRREGLHKQPTVTNEIAPLRVWLLALAILAIFIVFGATLLVILADPFTFLAGGDFGTACCAGTTVSFMFPLWA